MSKINPLAGLIGNYDDSEEEGDDTSMQSVAVIPSGVKAPIKTQPSEAARSGIHRAPISHCPWSACYDEASGFTYYWNQQTNAVTWEAPPEYLLALKIAQQQLNMGGSSQVSAAEWQMYQQVLAEQQTKSQTQPPAIGTTNDNVKKKLNVKNKSGYKRRISDEDEKIELITSYYHSDSESNDESESPVKAPPPPKPTLKPKVPAKKPKMKEKEPPIEYGPSLPPKQNYTVPIGPEMPTDYVITGSPKVKEGSRSTGEEEKLATKTGDKQEESDLLKKLKDKARILEKLGGDIPPELQEIIEDKHEEAIDNTNPPNDSIDDLLSEIEKTELPKVKTKKIETIEEGNSKPGSQTSSPHRDLSEHKTLFPSAKNIDDDVSNKDIPNNSVVEKPERSASPPEKSSNIYLSDLSETKEVVRKKLRISNSVLPDRSKTETPSYTTKYSQFIEGFSSERTGLGFTQEPMEDDCPKTTISYGNGLTFTKGETLNEEKQEDDVDDLEELVVAKLKYLNQLETNTVTPIQEMFIQMQTLRAVRGAERGAERGAGGAAARYWRAWLQGAARALRTHEAPPGWTCDFLRYRPRTLPPAAPPCLFMCSIHLSAPERIDFYCAKEVLIVNY